MTITDTAFESNTGGLLVTGASTVTVDRCRFRLNTVSLFLVSHSLATGRLNLWCNYIRFWCNLSYNHCHQFCIHQKPKGCKFTVRFLFTLSIYFSRIFFEG